MTRNPATASGSICLRHPYQNSGKPWSSMTTGPSFGPAATECKPISPFWMVRVSRELDLEADSTCPSGNTPYGKRESKAWSAGGSGAHFGSVDAETQARKVSLAERHAAGVEIAPNEEQQERHRGVVFIDDRVDDGQGKIEPEKDFRVGQPAGFVPVRLFREGALLPFDIEFWRAREFALLSNEIEAGNRARGREEERQVNEQHLEPALLKPHDHHRQQHGGKQNHQRIADVRGEVKKSLCFDVPRRVRPQDSRKNFLRGLHQALGPARLLGFEAVHVHGKLGSALDLGKVKEFPAFELRAIGKIRVFGQRVMFPATGFVDRFAAPHAGRPVEIEKSAAARTRAMLNDEVAVEQDRLHIREQ